MSDTTKAAATQQAPPSGDPEALRRDIAEKRRELGDTVAELAAKADVKAQVHERVEERKQAVRDSAHQARETVAAQASKPDPRALAAVAGAIAFLLLVLRKRRR
jgi:hypothetical protein